MKRVWIMRHSVRADQGNAPESDCSITQTGMHLAISRAMYLNSKTTKLNHIFSSPFARARETAQIVQTQFEGKPKIEITCDLAETLTEAHNNHINTTIPKVLVNLLLENGIVCPEPSEHVVQRCRAFIVKLKELKFTDVLIVSHAGLIQELVHEMTGMNCNLGYCDMVCVSLQGDKWVLCY